MSTVLGMTVRYETMEGGKDETLSYCVTCFFREGIEATKKKLDKTEPVYGWAPVLDEDLYYEDPTCCDRCGANLRNLGRGMKGVKVSTNLRKIRDGR